MWKEAQRCSCFWQVHLHWGKETVRGTVTSPCWFDSAFWETRVLTAGNVMLDTAATIPAAHIILQWQVRLWSGGRPAPVRELFRVQGIAFTEGFLYVRHWDRFFCTVFHFGNIQGYWQPVVIAVKSELGWKLASFAISFTFMLGHKIIYIHSTWDAQLPSKLRKQ